MKCIIFYSEKPAITQFFPILKEVTKKLGIECINSHLIHPHENLDIDKQKDFAKQSEIADFGICLGGDGTVLALAKFIYPSHLSILAINFGHLGFIAETLPDDLENALKAIISSQIKKEKRILLSIGYKTDNQIQKEEFLAVNEVFLGGNYLRKIGEFDVFIDGKEVFRYQSDGIIIATPTGSTAYSLSAGGPILVPHLEAFVLLAVAPHSLTNRPIVLSSETELEIQMIRPYNQNLLIDGQHKKELLQYESVFIKKALYHLNLIYPKERNYYKTLQKKLNWLA